jgi:hypothetical protein
VFDAVSVEVRDEDVMVEAALDYEPFPDDDQPAYVPRPPDTFEMLMIDLALSRDITGEPLRNPSEVDIVVARSRTGTLLRLASVIELLAAVSTALAVTLASLRYHARFEIALGVAMVTFAVLTFPALALRGGTAYARPPAPLALSHLCRLADR